MGNLHFQLNSHSIPYILLSDSFDEGRYNKPHSGGDWNEYQRGQNERIWNENVYEGINKKNIGSPSSRGESAGGGGGNGGCGFIILIVLALGIAIPTAVASLLSSLLIIVVVKMAIPSVSTVSFGEAYQAAFWTTFTYLATGSAVAFLQVWLYPDLNGEHEIVSIFSVVKYFYFLEGFQHVKPINLFIFHLACISLSALMLQNKMKVHLAGFKGYGLSVLRTAIIILPSILATLYFGVSLLLKYYQQNLLF